jgi:hypothetical protein
MSLIPENSDIIISTMGIRGSDFDGWRVIEWPGVSKSGGHPSWAAKAASMRGPLGLIPNILRQYGIKKPRRIGLVGFSAGSNSGLRELLRDPLDRALASFAVSADGMHMAVRSDYKRGSELADDDLIEPSQLEPFKSFARTGKPFVITASNVERPIPTVTKTREAMLNIEHGLAEQPVKQDYGLEGNTWSKGNVLFYITDGNMAKDHVHHANSIPTLLRRWVMPKLETP